MLEGEATDLILPHYNTCRRLQGLQETSVCCRDLICGVGRRGSHNNDEFALLQGPSLHQRAPQEIHQAHEKIQVRDNNVDDTMVQILQGNRYFSKYQNPSQFILGSLS